MSLSFRHRILLILIGLGTLPTAAALLGWVLTVRSSNPVAAGRTAIEQVGETGREFLQTVDTLRMRPAERRALARHVAQLNEAMSRAQQAEVYTTYYTGALALLLLLFGLLVIYASVRLGGHLTRQLSRPIEELIGWTEHIRRHQPLPADRPRRGAPEFASLRTALREMAANLETGRARELEAERLRAFQEVARRVAHEMKNPLTPIRFAVAQLQRSPPTDGTEALEVIRAEADRLEQLAREFTELGRLPQGPAAAVDLGELLDELRRTSLPPEVEATISVAPGTPQITGHYDALRRAFGNILRNAAEAMDGRGRLEIDIGPEQDGATVRVADHGPGIDPALAGQLFEPYVTGKARGTGLGLTLVRQTVQAHGGHITAGPTPGGGATFVIHLPAGAASPVESSA